MSTVNPETAVAPAATSADFVDRRTSAEGGNLSGERRQFSNSHTELSEEARELAVAIDEYKLRHRRRFITYEEMFNVITQLGYRRDH